MAKAFLIGLLTTFLLTIAPPAEAQQSKKVHRIGFLGASSPSAISGRLDAFRQGLRERGYVEGKNIVIEYRYAEGKLDRLPALAAELVGLKVDVMVLAGPASIHPAKEATNTIPIVMANDADPVGSGVIVSLARPGGNITGLSNLAPEMGGKRLELLKEIVPSLGRVAVLGTSSTAGTAQVLREMELAAGVFKLRLQYLDVSGPKDIETAFREARKGRADAALVLQGGVFNSQRKQIAALAVKSRLPAIYHAPEYVEDGGLMSYGVSVTDLYRRAATYVDKILKGAKPAELPVTSQQSSSLVINLKTAKQIGLTVLGRADRVIK